MAFGAKATYKDEVQATGETKVYERAFMDTHSGNRKFRMFSDETEFFFLSAWWPCTVNGNNKNVRFFLDYKRRWENPFWEFLAKTYPPKSQQRRAMKVNFALNVYETTQTIISETGALYFQDERGRFLDLETNKVVEGTPTPLNRVRILEGTAGDLPGKHLYAKLVSACTGIVDPDENPIKPHEVDMILKTTGTTMDNTERAFVTSSNFKPLPAEVLQLPRWDIPTWATPWPDEAVIALLNGEDFTEVAKNFPALLENRFPRKYGDVSPADSDDLFAD